MLTLLPLTFLQFFWMPYMEAQALRRRPRKLDAGTRDHVVLVQHDPMSIALVERLVQFQYSYLADRAGPRRGRAAGRRGDQRDPRRSRRSQDLPWSPGGRRRPRGRRPHRRDEHPDRLDGEGHLREHADHRHRRPAGLGGHPRAGGLRPRPAARRPAGRVPGAAHDGGRTPWPTSSASSASCLSPRRPRRTPPSSARPWSRRTCAGRWGIHVIGVWERRQFQPARPETRITAQTVLCPRRRPGPALPLQTASSPSTTSPPSR